jgi:Zn-dependent oligopeptidase
LINVFVLAAAESPASFTDIVSPLETLSLPLDAAWGVLKTLSLVESKQITPETYSKVHERARRARAKRFHSPAIYQAMKVAFFILIIAN